VRKLLFSVALVGALVSAAVPALAEDMPLAGADGAAGEPGEPGQPGAAGQPGAPGKRSADGAPGHSSSSGTGNVIIRPGTQVRAADPPRGPAPSTASVGPTEDFVNSDLPLSPDTAPTAVLEPGPEPAPVVVANRFAIPVEPPQETAPGPSPAATFAQYALGTLGLLLAATVLLPMKLINVMLGVKPVHRSGSGRSSVRG
jgi:hypothetical protein